jgi:hypothetical protein
MRKPRAGSWLVAAVAGSTLLTLLLGAATRLDPVPLGLNAEYFTNTTQTGSPAGTTIDTEPSTNHLFKEWNGSPPESFSETWTGAVCPLREGTYVFAADADTAATVVVDGQVIAEKDPSRGDQPAAGRIHLTPGAHPVLIRYAHNGGPVRFNLLWARGNEPLAPVPAWALRPRKIRSVPRLMARAALDRAFALSEWVWVGTLLLAAMAVTRRGVSRIRAVLERACAWPALKWILGASLILNLAGIWWGLPGSWVAIELKPAYILSALSQHFSHGWYDAYPPVHFYLLSAAMSPMLLLNYLDRITFDGAVAYTLLVLISRFVSIALAAGMVAAACVCGTRAFGRRAGLIAAAMVAVTAPFLYYAKTANVDVSYLFWWALSMVFYLRLLDTERTSDYVLFAAAATLSVCTKDQAYGLYLLAPLVFVEQLWRVNWKAGVPRAFLRALFDRRLVIAALASGVLFVLCHNLFFNPGGFMDHVRFITGPGSAVYRVYEPTLAGHLELLRLTIRLIEVSMGWPLFLAGVIGLVIATATPRLRRTTIWLLVPVVSYYLGFINVILYNYDRFVLPMCFVLAIFGGLAFDRLLSSSGRLRSWGRAAVAGAFAYTLLYAGTVDVLMIEDSRYAVERWMSAHVGRNELVALSGLREYLPRLDDFRLEDIGTVAELQREHPNYVVLNADYARAVPPDTPWGQFIAGLEHEALGYHLVGRFRRDAPWPWLPGGHPDLVGARQETIVFSTLRNINPTIEIFQRNR